MDDFLPCPVCHSENVRMYTDTHGGMWFYPYCESCNISGKRCLSEEIAVETWNALPRLPWKRAATRYARLRRDGGDFLVVSKDDWKDHEEQWAKEDARK